MTNIYRVSASSTAVRRRLHVAGHLLALCLSSTAFAQTARPDDNSTADEDAGIGATEITVTGSRIVRDGFSAPTPVTVLSQADIEAQAPVSLTNFVNQLPAVTQGYSAGNTTGLVSTGLAGINSLNLRGLGAGRTLVLIDGQRSVASSVGGIVDINTIPQNLVERVEVVTGGASAQYGSDAVGGVVNFLLKKDFKGLKLAADQGVTGQGDGRNYRFGATAGFTALDGRLHVLLDGSYFRQKGVDTIARDWNDTGYFQINNPAYTATNGQPQRLVGSGFAPATYTAGGLITSGPLQGTYFLGRGVTGKLNYGTTNSTSSPWMIGGDGNVTLAGHANTNSLIPSEKRYSIFNRVAFDVSDNVEVYAQFAWSRHEADSNYQQTPSTGVSIKQDNAYLNLYYPTIAAQIAPGGSITIGTSNAGFPIPGTANRREVFRYVAGAKGKFSLFDHGWTWDAYFQRGLSRVHQEATYSWNTARMALAQDAVVSNGQIVCRSSIANPGNGCVPINRLGVDGPSAAALAYIYGPTNPYRDDRIRQDVGAASLSGAVLDLPGGPLSVAIGGEWRREAVDGYVDPQFNSGWLYGNFLVTRGSYTVKEGFLEVDLPLLRGVDVNAAGRVTDYSTSSTVATWKVGATYSPIADIKLRGTISRDIRAPNLQELFAAGLRQTNTVILPSNAPITGSQQFTENTVGNLNLKPEVAKTWTAGVVVSPSAIPGLSLSFDYYDIKITDAIGTVTSQNTVDFCYGGGGGASFCNNISYVGGALSGITLQPFNYASQREKGFDIEASYRTPLSRISARLPGAFNIHAAITHYISNVVDNRVFPVDYAGVNAGGTYAAPSWVYRVSAFYDVDPFSFNLVARGFGSGVYGNDYVQCTSGCPTSSTRYLTINNNQIAGATYFDLSASAKFKASGVDGKLSFIVNNLTDKNPVLVGNGPNGNNVPAYVQTNRSLYDVIGRTFRVAATIQL